MSESTPVKWGPDAGPTLSPEKVRALLDSKLRLSNKARSSRLDECFILTPEEWGRLEVQQGGVCFICQKPPKNCSLNTDHSHKSGLIRGLLCPSCNKGLQFFKDNTDFLHRAAHYLTYPPAVGALCVPRFTLPGRAGTKKAKRLRKKIEAAGKLDVLKFQGFAATGVK